jgi:hypothetical protein
MYEKAGFVQIGRVPRKGFRAGQCIGEVIVTNLIE